MSRRLFGSIRTRVLVLFLASVLVFTMIVMAVTGVVTRSLVTDLIEDNARALIRHQSDLIALWQRERMADLRQLANSDLVETMDWDLIEPFLQRQLEEAPPYYLIFFVADPSGHYDTTAQRNAGNISDRPYFPRVFAGETVISEPLISRSTDQRVVIVATPIWNEERTEVRGLLGLSIDLEQLFHRSQELIITDQHDSLYLVDENGYFILHPNPELIMNSTMHELYPEWESLPAQQGAFTSGQNGQSMRIYYQKLPGPSSWTVAVQVPTSYFSAPVHQLVLDLCLVGISGLAVMFWLGSWFASTISQPIVELNEIFKRGAAGELTVRAQVASDDEIGQTRASFNRMMDTIGSMTYYDPLTGLPNREQFMDSLSAALGENGTIILALVSIRDLSQIKTFYSSRVTEEVLLELAEKLQAVSDSSLVTARTGEGEFGLIIPSTAHSVLQVIDRLDRLLAEPLSFARGELTVRLFGGISISLEQDLGAEVFYQQAQTALYEAEHSREEPLKLYNPSVHQALVEQLRFQTEIRTALEEGQFTVFYQPIVDLRCQNVVGKEALIRWQHPARGLLTPGQFLSAAEQGGFMEELGEYVLNEVCAQHRSWLDEGMEPGWVSVNISALHFRSPHFPAQVGAVLKKYGLPSELLRLEITEDAMLAPTEEVLLNFQELNSMGVRIAIDDFGKAYSSLQYLARYPMEALKIDKAFIDDIDQDERVEGLVRSIIGMGMNLAMRVVAEGVERENQLALLRQMGCFQAQGYLFSRPVPREEYLKVRDQVLLSFNPI